MNTYKKIIFLKSSSNTSTAIVTLESKNNSTFGSIKAQDLDGLKSLVLGIKNGGNFAKQNIILNNGFYSFKLTKTLDLNDQTSCLLLDTSEDNIKCLMSGKDNENRIDIINYLKKEYIGTKKINTSSIDAPTKQTTPNKENSSTTECSDANTQPQIDSPIEGQTQINFEDNLEDTRTNIQSNQTEEIATANALPNEKLFEYTDEDINEDIDNNMSENSNHEFYNMIADQIDELFSRYPREENLETLVENSEWVKIDTEIDNKYYVVGKIYENNAIKYICYGVPGNYDIEPPIELRGYSQWLPIDTKSPYTSGYWVMYQDADTGENIYLN